MLREQKISACNNICNIEYKSQEHFWFTACWGLLKNTDNMFVPLGFASASHVSYSECNNHMQQITASPSLTDALGKVSHLLLLDHKGYGYSPPEVWTKAPTYPWKIPPKFHQQFMKEFLSLWGFGGVWGIFPGYVGKIIVSWWRFSDDLDSRNERVRKGLKKTHSLKLQRASPKINTHLYQQK